MLKKIKKKTKSFSHFIWLILLITVTSFVTYFYEVNKETQYLNLKKTLQNVYFQKALTKITNTLEDRYKDFLYVVKEGDNYESIINSIEVSNAEKKVFLETIKKNQTIKILRPNQKIYFKIDKKDKPKIIEFIIEVSKKKEIYFVRNIENENFKSKTIEKNLKKIVTYKESKITSSLYQSAINLKIRPNIIIEFARLYGFQVDFQRDIWKDDSFQIIYEEFLNDGGEVIETGRIIFANLVFAFSSSIPLTK